MASGQPAPNSAKSGWEKILVPLKILKHGSAMFWLWTLVVVSIANLGIVMTFYSNTDQLGFYYSLLLNVRLGNFYTASIAMIAWGFYDFAKDYVKQNSHFRTYKASTFLTAFILTIFYAMFAIGSSIPVDQPAKDFLTTLRWFEIIFPILCYFFAFCVSIYIYCVSWMEDDRYIDQFSADDDVDYSDQSDERRDSIKANVPSEGVLDGGVAI